VRSQQQRFDAEMVPRAQCAVGYREPLPPKAVTFSWPQVGHHKEEGMTMDMSTINTVPATPEAGSESRRDFRHKLKAASRDEVQVVVPKVVDIPLPKGSGQQISVPASINGRDLSDGKP